jgi:hypothetical protein
VNQSTRLLAIVALVATTSAAAAWSFAPAGPQDGAPPSLATPEHKLLEKYVGTWDAEISMAGPPGTPKVKSPAKSVARLACGGLWLLTDFESSMMGAPFGGHEVFGYDATAKQYVGNWVDSMSTAFAIGEFAYDAKGRKVEGIVHGRDMMGNPTTWRQVDVWKDDDTREWAMYRKSADGKEAVELEITYRRKK